jgi:hypothetical protein
MDFTYRVTDLLTGQVTEDVALGQTNITWELSGIGDMTSSLFNRDQRNKNKDLNAALIPGRTALYVFYGNAPIWGGFISNRVYHTETGLIDLSGNSLEGIFSKIYLIGLPGGEKVYTNKSAAFIVNDLLTWIQSDSALNFGFQFADLSTGTVPTFDWEVHDYDQMTFGKALSQLAGDAVNGFDWNIHYDLDASLNVVKTLVIGAPTLGVSQAATGLEWDYWPAGKSNIRGITWTENAAPSAVDYWGADNAEGYAKSFSHVTNTALIAAGWPRLTETASFDADDLDGATLAAAQSLIPPKTSPSFRVNGDTEPLLGTYSVGDYALFSIRDDFLGVVDNYYRIRSISANSGTSDVYLALVGVDD